VFEGKKQVPRVSVIMGVSNGAATVRRAIRSIQEQTFTDWEYVVCDDASSDGTWGILQEATSEDSRIRLIRQEKNSGLAAALNRCIDAAEGQYLARQDADDFSLSTRLKEQVTFLDDHPDVSVVGTYVNLTDSAGRVWGQWTQPLSALIRDWVRGPKVIHASVVMRKRHIVDVGKYDEKAVRVEDYDLWFRMLSKGYKIATIPRPLYNVHWDRSDYSRRKFRYRWIEAQIRWKGFKALKVPTFYYPYVLKPIAVGMLPHLITHLYHVHKFRKLARTLDSCY
jgi:glycosyltransferase EpsE